MDAWRRRRCRWRRRAGIRSCGRPCPWRAGSRWFRRRTGSAPACENGRLRVATSRAMRRMDAADLARFALDGVGQDDCLDALPSALRRPPLRARRRPRRSDAPRCRQSADRPGAAHRPPASEMRHDGVRQFHAVGCRSMPARRSRLPVSGDGRAGGDQRRIVARECRRPPATPPWPARRLRPAGRP